jgi:hypothetical protein
VKDGQATAFDVGEWKSTVASRKNDDGTISFITIDPTLDDSSSSLPTGTASAA